MRRFAVLLTVAALAVLAPSGASAKALPGYQVAGLQVALYRFLLARVATQALQGGSDVLHDTLDAEGARDGLAEAQRVIR